MNKVLKRLAFAAGGLFIAAALAPGLPLVIVGAAVGAGVFGPRIANKISRGINKHFEKKVASGKPLGPIGRFLKARRTRIAANQAMKQKEAQRLNELRNKAIDDAERKRAKARHNALAKKTTEKAKAFAKKIDTKTKSYNARLTKEFNPVAAIFRTHPNATILPKAVARVAPVIKNHKMPAAKAQTP